MFLIPNNKINITLCGMMGSGKTAVGRMLAKKIDFSFIDTDKLIEERAGKSIDEIFKEDGEDYFRKLEEENIMSILQKKKFVISLGGGSILNSILRKIIKDKSYNIYLEVDNDTLEKRLKNSKNRPLISSKNIKQILIKLIKKRENYYKEADLIVSNKENIDKSVKHILKKL